MNYSAVYEIVPPTDERGHYLIEDGKPFGPEQPHWVYVADDTVSFWSSFISGAHRTANGSTFITEGAKGRFFEVTSDGDIMWEYLNPYRGNITFPNGDPKPVMPLVYYQFRATLIPMNHPALAGRDLQPIEPQPEPFKVPPPPDGKKTS